MITEPKDKRASYFAIATALPISFMCQVCRAGSQHKPIVKFNTINANRLRVFNWDVADI